MISESVKGQKLSSPYLVKRRYRLCRLEKVYSFTRWDRSAPKCIMIVNALEEMNDHTNRFRNDDPLSSISIVFQGAIKRLHDATQWTRSALISKHWIVVHNYKPMVDSSHGNPIIITLKRLSTVWNVNWSRESVIMNTFHRERGWICQSIIRRILFFLLFFLLLLK